VVPDAQETVHLCFITSAGETELSHLRIKQKIMRHKSTHI